MADTAKTLSAPLRVYWALEPEHSGGLGHGLAEGVARELGSLKVFFVTLRLSAGPRADLAELVAALKPAVRVVVSVADEAAFPEAGALAAADGLDLMPADIAGLRALLRLASGVEGGPPLSVSVVPAKDNAGFVDEALAVSVAAGVRAFNLPNPDLTGDAADPARFALDAQARAGLKAAIESRLGPLGNDIRLGVHDLFLHAELKLPGLGTRIEYAGCQAGDAIAFIDAAGLVYPCSTWPEPLGSLKDTGFREIWTGEGRREMRRAARTLPRECGGCPEARECKGGCVGLALALGRPGGRDPGCAR